MSPHPVPQLTVTAKLRPAGLCFAPLIPLLALCLLVGGCCQHDPQLVNRLTVAKASVAGTSSGGTTTPGLYDRFTEPEIPANDLQTARQQLDAVVRTATENKKWFCDEPVNQAKQIRKRFQEHVRAREQDGPWSETIRDNRKENMSDLFDRALETQEDLK